MAENVWQAEAAAVASYLANFGDSSPLPPILPWS